MPDGYAVIKYLSYNCAVIMEELITRKWRRSLTAVSMLFLLLLLILLFTHYMSELKRKEIDQAQSRRSMEAIVWCPLSTSLHQSLSRPVALSAAVATASSGLFQREVNTISIRFRFSVTPRQFALYIELHRRAVAVSDPHSWASLAA